MNETASAGATATQVERHAATPVAGAIAGILFAALFGVSVGTIHANLPDLSRDVGAGLETGAGRIKIAVALLPFAGLFFLWFIAVARQRLGRFEDQFFATVFLGSGLLFLAMMFAAAATAAAIIAVYARDPSGLPGSVTYLYARHVIAQIFSVYALRMAAVFMISQATIWMRTGVMPRWMAMLTVGLALVLLFIFTQSAWVIMVFPAWVFMVSVYILVSHLRGHVPATS